MDKPVLRRDIQLITTIIKGKRMIAFHDPYRLTGDGIALDINTLPILQLLDGFHDLRDIQAMLMRRHGGRIVYVSQIESFIESLDRECLLESPSFDQKMCGLRSEFSKRQTRMPVHAGKSYASEPDQLTKFIENMENNAGQEYVKSIPENITGILAPHIDINIGRDIYVNTYRSLKGRNYDTVVILGINHHVQDGLYCISEKTFLTPFGEIKSDKNFIVKLKERVPEGTFAPDDFGHMTEHSVEFQTVFLHHYLAGPFTIVPILCGGVHEFIQHGTDILTDERFRGMVSVMKELLVSGKGRMLLVAGVDLSHVGRKFGDQVPADAVLPQAIAHDKKMLSFLSRGEPDKIFRAALETKDRYHVCGLPAILLFASLLAENRAEVLCFDTYHEHETESAVNYASLISTMA
ncbi:MAG TPA: AmmeMemoRadiSam system protein B [Syntrophales bacterium]|nr:AmmeMemoRadiSam system protein B [Syntrophales bacterium]